MNAIFIACIVLVHGATSELNPYVYGSYNSPLKIFGYNLPQYTSYANQVPYSAYIPYRRIEDFYTSSDDPILNVLAEVPYSIGNTFTVVPMVIVSKATMKMVNKGEIMTVSKQRPEMTLKTEQNNILHCTPAVKIILDTPMLVYSLKSNIVFPSQIEIVHETYKIPIKVGAVVAPVAQGTFVSVDTPISLSIVYAVPSEPVKIDYVNNEGVVINADGDSVIVERLKPQLPPKNITVINFPEAEAEPVLQVDEDDEELEGTLKM